MAHLLQPLHVLNIPAAAVDLTVGEAYGELLPLRLVCQDVYAVAPVAPVRLGHLRLALVPRDRRHGHPGVRVRDHHPLKQRDVFAEEAYTASDDVAKAALGLLSLSCSQQSDSCGLRLYLRLGALALAPQHVRGRAEVGSGSCHLIQSPPRASSSAEQIDIFERLAQQVRCRVKVFQSLAPLPLPRENLGTGNQNPRQLLVLHGGVCHGLLASLQGIP
mmetsp:Transcript_9077/g.18803  ORF Transcript_9077/g.18803 Transcript_9077/m.18803 type:complete len:218 (+) Transcript_9077:319-972(+)